MKQFLVRCLSFSLPVLAFLVLLEGYARQIPNSYRQKKEWMDSHAHEVEVLLLGNSHGLFGLKPDCFLQKAYNLCQVSQTLEYDEYLLKHYAPACSSLKDVVLVVDNSGFFDLPLEQTESYRCIYYRLYMDYPKHSLWSSYGFELSDMSAMKKKLTLGGTQCDSLGWNPEYTLDRRQDDYLSDAEVNTAVSRHRCKDWQVAGQNRQTLLRIAQYCRLQGFRLWLLQAPVSQAYFHKLDTRELRYLRESCNIPGVSTVDFSADSRFHDNDFFDVDHLADVGAAKWSKIVSRTLVAR